MRCRCEPSCCFHMLLFAGLFYRLRKRYNNAAIAAPRKGPIIGTHPYFQLLLPLPLMGSIACAILGPKSLAGLIAYPVVPPSERPIAHTRKATGKAPSDPRPIGVFGLRNSASEK